MIVFMLSMWHFNILRPLRYIYRIQSDFEFEQKIQILLDVKLRHFFIILQHDWSNVIVGFEMTIPY